jgi:hypothetical protein
MSKNKENKLKKLLRDTIDSPAVREAAVALLIAVGKKAVEALAGKKVQILH